MWLLLIAIVVSAGLSWMVIMRRLNSDWFESIEVNACKEMEKDGGGRCGSCARCLDAKDHNKHIRKEIAP